MIRPPDPTSEDGATSVEFALFAPVLLTVVLAVGVWFALTIITLNSATTAAEHAVDAIAATGDTAAGQRVAAEILDFSSFATTSSTDVSIDADSVTVTVTAEPLSILLPAIPVTATAEARLEEFRNVGERR